MEVVFPSILIEWTFNETAIDIWQAWTNPVWISKWFGSDPAGRVLSASLDVKKGGCFEVNFADSDGTEHVCSGSYMLVEPFEQLKFSWQWKTEPDVVSEVSIFLKEDGDRTKMFFSHTGVGKHSLHDYETGWRKTFLKLEKAMA